MKYRIVDFKVVVSVSKQLVLTLSSPIFLYKLMLNSLLVYSFPTNVVESYNFLKILALF